MSKVNGAGKTAKNGNGSAEEPGGSAVVRKAPKNARVVKPSYKTGTISRAAARAAIKAVMEER
jgi:hypothetical protein